MSKDIPLQLKQLNQLNKNTKKKELTNKERINSILEKYNLKTPRKTQLIDKKKDFQIKPKSTNNEPTQQLTKLTTEPIKQPPKLITEPAQQPKPQLQYKPQPHPQPQPQLSVNNLLNKDKQELTNQKTTMPQAIVNKNNSKDFINSENMYNIITKLNKQKDYSHLQNQSNTNNNNRNSIQPIHNTNNDTTKTNKQIKITLTPEETRLHQLKEQQLKEKLMKEKQLKIQQLREQQLREQEIKQQMKENYIKEKDFKQQQLKEQQIILEQMNHNSIINRNRNNTINNFSNTNNSSNTNTDNTNNIKQIVYNNGNSNSKKNVSIHPKLEHMTIDAHSPLSKLELQRQYLQEQQQKELAKLKHKKEQIVKLHNRKKEIELMKSIENEKHKLRLIQNKQEELNKYLPYLETTRQTTNNNTSNNNNTNTNDKGKQENKIVNINTASTLNNNTHRIYNVDEKKTKKNNLLMKDAKDVIDVVKKPILIKKTNPINPMIEPSFNTLDIKNTKLKVKVKKEEKKEEEVKKEEEEKKEKKIIKEQIIKEVKEEVKKKDLNNQPYHYYCKRDIKKYNLDVDWGTKEEVYNTDKMTKTLTMYLSIHKPFNYKCEINNNKDTKTLEEKKHFLKKEYKYKKISHFCKDKLIDLLYKIYCYDTMIIEIKNK